ncbi:MAG: murein biosynthesis integral membrane protein MurJ [Rickettsiaceae bacterium]
MLIKSGVIVAFFTLVSRVFGLARELFVAYTFGTSSIADCVNVAFKFPNLFRRIFGEGALSAVFVPMFSQKLVASKREAKIFGGKVFTLLLVILIAITIILEIIMPYIMIFIAPGFVAQKEKCDLAIVLCRITTPYLIFISITAVFGGMLNSVKKFAAFACVPIILNICVICITYGLQGEYLAHYSIAYSIIIAGVLQVLFMYVCLYRAGLAFSFTFDVKDKEVRTLVKNMGPATMSYSAQQLNLFISQSIASFLPGAVSILSYADRLYQLPLALIGISLGTILLPELSQIYKRKDYIGANFVQNRVIQVAMIFSIPATCGLVALSMPIIHLIYERGQFSATDTIMTAHALTAFAFGLPAFVLAKILIPIFYANLDMKTPLRISIYSLIINTLLSIILMITFGHVGIAAGYSISAWINVFLLNKYARQHGEFKIIKQTKIFIVKTICLSSVMLSFIAIITYSFEETFYSESIVIKITSLCCTIIASIIILLLVAFILGMHKTLIQKKS